VFLLIVFGYILGRTKLITPAFCAVSDKLVFRVALPVLLFRDMALTDIRGNFDLPYLLFCAGATTVIFFVLWFVSKRLLPKTAPLGEFVQVSYRSSAAILGCALLLALYGDTGAAPLMILGSVPLFNIYAVLVLTLERPHAEARSLAVPLRHAFLAAATNPIILAIIAGLLPSLGGLTAFPPMLDSILNSFAALATPLALLSVGASLVGKPLAGDLRLTGVAAFIKLLLLPALFLPLALCFGFTGAKLAALLIMLGSTSTPTCYIMARNLGHDGSLTLRVVVLTTVVSAFTLTFWLFLARFLGYL
jgi:predicted permease